MQSVAELRFRAMGSDAHLIVVGGHAGLVEQARCRVDDLERRWSRFIETSEVSKLNRRAGDGVAVSTETRLLVARAIEAWRRTGGSFDPTLLGAVIRAGYDVSFDRLSSDRSRPTSDLLTGCTDIEITDGTVRLPRGTGFDPGGIGKGLAADIVIGEMLAAGAAGACVNLGGDLRVAGTGPLGEAWTIAIEHPSIPDPIAMIGLHAGAVATSTTLRRRWDVDGAIHHHLIDPATGEPSRSDLDLTTVIAGEAWIAEVLAKAVLLRGSDRAFDLIDDSDAFALTVDRDRNVRTTPRFRDFIGGS